MTNDQPTDLPNDQSQPPADSAATPATPAIPDAAAPAAPATPPAPSAPAYQPAAPAAAPISPADTPAYQPAGAAAYAYVPPAASTSPGNGLAIAALIVAVFAFLIGWLPVIGAVVGLIGLVLGIIALRKRGGRGMSITAVILSSLAVLTSVALFVVGVMFGDEIQRAFENSTGANPTTGAPAAALHPIETPCYEFQAPANFFSTVGAADIEDCFTQLELTGSVDEEGNFTSSLDGEIQSEVFGEIVPDDIVATWETQGDLDATVAFLGTSYYAELGTSVGTTEDTQLGGVDAKITRVADVAKGKKSTAVIAAFAPSKYPTTEGEGSLVVISFTTFDGDEKLLNDAIESWEWK